MLTAARLVLSFSDSGNVCTGISAQRDILLFEQSNLAAVVSSSCKNALLSRLPGGTTVNRALNKESTNRMSGTSNVFLFGAKPTLARHVSFCKKLKETMFVCFLTHKQTLRSRLLKYFHYRNIVLKVLYSFHTVL